MKNFSEISNFIWSIADLIRDVYKRGKYQDVILPFTVLRRIDCVLEPTREQVLKVYNQYKDEIEDLTRPLAKASGYAFYNTSKYNFERLLDDPQNLAANLRHYINSFSPNMREVIEKFDFDNTIKKLNDSGLLFMVMERFKSVSLHPDVVSNTEMGYIFEELIRKFNEATNENPGEHYTPREVIRLMVKLLLSKDREVLEQDKVTRTIYDPCVGTGGMLDIAKTAINEFNPNIDVFMFGQEVNPETFAVCKSDLYMKSKDGLDAENIKFGSTLSNDQHRSMTFHYQLSNPPYGKDWKMDKDAVEMEYERGYAGRFGAGLPRSSDGQLLFLQHMISKIKPVQDGGGRIAIIMNGSPLFTGDAGSGESEIRRWILENDWLDAIIALPEQLFYNTGIATYVWILSNHKESARKNKVQLIDAREMWVPMRKSLGDKRRRISSKQIAEIAAIYEAFEPGEKCRIFDTTDFGYRKITVERPLRLNFQVNPERIERLRGESAFANLAVSKKKDAEVKASEEAEGRKYQEQIIDAIASIPDILFKDRSEFDKTLGKALRSSDIKLAAAVKKSVLSALSERDETAEICRDKNGDPEPDSELRDTENVPLMEDIWGYFDREVKPHVADVWINQDVKDHKDGEIGKVGYEINFNRYFYKYIPPRPLEDIEADIRALEAEILGMIQEVA